MVGCYSTAAAVYRRQHFLIRCLGGQGRNFYNSNYHYRIIRMKPAISGGHSLEADAGSIVRSITPTLDTSRHKGQAGKLSLLIYFLWAFLA